MKKYEITDIAHPDNPNPRISFVFKMADSSDHFASWGLMFGFFTVEFDFENNFAIRISFGE